MTAETFEKAGIAPDFTCEDKRWLVSFTHRRYPAAGGADAYFVACGVNSDERLLICSFRTAGRVPELWNAEDGSVCDAPFWYVKDGRTYLRLDMPPRGAVFVVFRRPAEKTPTENAAGSAWMRDRARLKAVREIPVEGPWNVTFSSPAKTPGAAVFEKLVAWPERPEDDIRHFSGTATYEKRVCVKLAGLGSLEGKRIWLDLGAVKNIARVTVNGKAFPEIWRTPFRVDVTSLLPAPGAELALDLKIEVANLWVNRLIGDARLPEDCKRSGAQPAAVPEWLAKSGPSPAGRTTFSSWAHWDAKSPLLPSGLLGPVALRILEERQAVDTAVRAFK